MRASIISVAAAVFVFTAATVHAQAAQSAPAKPATPAAQTAPAAAASPATPAAGEGPGKYVGVAKCKMCHKKAEDGDQYDVWLKSGHAKAFATLASEKAKAEATKEGIADPQKDPKCLKCHTTAAMVADPATEKVTMEEGVSCESCHGAGSGYYKKKVMEDLRAGKVDAKTVGFVKPTKETCVKCHTAEGNAFFKPFVFEERVKVIAHPIPKKAAPAAG
ncbi:MAG: cytochrome c family protein [bacterium]